VYSDGKTDPLRFFPELSLERPEAQSASGTQEMPGGGDERSGSRTTQRRSEAAAKLGFELHGTIVTLRTDRFVTDHQRSVVTDPLFLSGTE
jgi:hypothetical protein